MSAVSQAVNISTNMESKRDSSSSFSFLLSDNESRHYIKTGIGGAGNFRPRAPPTFSHSSSMSSQASYASTAVSFRSGIGGAGNVHPITEKSSMTREEFEARQKLIKEHKPRSWHFGIGGAGNRTPTVSKTSRLDSFNIVQRLRNSFHEIGDHGVHEGLRTGYY